MVGGLAHSGRVIFAAAAVMVAVFFTFALSGPLPPKEMGIILGIAVLLDAMLDPAAADAGPAQAARPVGLVPAALGGPESLPDVRFGHGRERLRRPRAATPSRRYLAGQQ